MAQPPFPSKHRHRQASGFLAFAKANYRFADGRTLRTEAVRSCRAR